MVSNDSTSDPPPVILSRPADHVLVNTAYDFPIIASDAAGDNVTFSIAPNTVNMTGLKRGRESFPSSLVGRD